MFYPSVESIHFIFAFVWLIPRGCSAGIPHVFWVGRDLPFTCNIFRPRSFVRPELGLTGPHVRVMFPLKTRYICFEIPTYCISRNPSNGCPCANRPSAGNRQILTSMEIKLSRSLFRYLFIHTFSPFVLLIFPQNVSLI